MIPSEVFVCVLFVIGSKWEKGTANSKCADFASEHHILCSQGIHNRGEIVLISKI